MKLLLVCDEIGNAIYSDVVDHSGMMCLPFATSQAMLQEAFGQRFSVVRYENGASFVFSSTVQSDDDVLFFMIWSDEGDSVPFLKRQLQLLSELILFKYGPHVNFGKQAHRMQYKPQRTLKSLISTMTHLGNSQQSYLVQSIERLEVNDDIRLRCVRALEEATLQHKGSSAIHVLLFVGTRLVAQHSRTPKPFDLSAPDIFLIMLYIKALHDQANPAPVPSTHTNASGSLDDTPMSRHDEADDVFFNTKEEMTPDDREPPVEFTSRQSTSSDSASFHAPEDEMPAAPEFSVSETVYLKGAAGTHQPYFLYAGQVAASMTMVVISDNLSEADRERQMQLMSSMQNTIRRLLSNFLDFLLTKEQTHMTMLSFVSYYPGLIHFIYVDRGVHQVIAPIIVPLHASSGEGSDADTLRRQRSMANDIRKRVWDLVYESQERLAQGYTTMVMKKDDFCYFYNLWFEDTEGNILPVEGPLPHPEKSHDRYYFRDLCRTLFPQNRNVVCYELFTLHVSIVPVKMVVSQNWRLVRMLRESRSQTRKFVA